ncbi:Protein N-methyltransferase nnt1 [Cytospora mali]|uniref:Protein N-terminal and lysine N-methyltransferase EFM7 n=1 Tax=Cytospora mali TaxID=578113 RepID=A0A194UPE5_CYTMA|nr:Protein N-methyltransferase nnt1 [Valsa mali var. pyri (nom. inval.)]
MAPSSDIDDIDTADVGLFDEPEDYYPPSPKPTMQTYTTHQGQTINLHLVGYSPTEAHHLWNGSRVISDYFESNPSEVKDRTVLELGAGAGLPSIMAAVLGARKVVMTDFPDADIVATMWKNIDECKFIPSSSPSSSSVSTGEQEDGERKQDVLVAKGFVWGFDPVPLLAELPNQPDERFDVLILADLLFRHSEHGALLNTIRDTLKRSRDSKAFVFFTSYRPWLQHKDLAFFDLARERGYVVDKILDIKMERPLFEDDPGDKEILKTCTGWVVKWPESEIQERQ